MLQLTRGISLADVARAHLPGASLCLVGSSGPTRLLLACDAPAAADGESNTQVHCYDLETRRLTLLYTHAGRCKCVGASVDAQETIMSLTQEELRDKDGQLRTYFKTSLAEIQPAGEAYRLNVRSQLVQHVQFLQSKGGVTLFLFIIEGMFIRLYQMHSRKRAGGGVKITAQPLLLSEIIKKFVWYQWDAAEERLYVLTPAGALRCYGFPKKEKLQFECPLGAPALPAVYLGYRHFAHCARAVCSTHLQMTAVKMADGGLCFCVHHAGAVTVYIVHHNLKLVMPCASELPVSFLRQAPSTLVIWVPNQSVTMINCGLHHTPMTSLHARAPPVGGAEPLRHMLALGPATLMDAHSGVLYSTGLDRAALLDCLNRSDPFDVTLHMQCVHTAVMMMDDDAELVGQIMRSALGSRSGAAVSPELLGEYVVATVYRRLQRALPAHVAQLLPITTLEPLLRQRNVTLLPNYAASIIKGQLYVAELESNNNNNNNNTNATSSSASSSSSALLINTPSNAVGNHHTLLQAPVGIAFDGSPSGGPSLNSSFGASGEPPSAVQRLVSMLFGSSESDLTASDEGSGDDGPERVSVCRSWGGPYEEALADSLLRALPNRESRAKCLRLARQIRRAQLDAVAAAHALLCEAAAAMRDTPAVFRLYESLYGALEELSLPLPPGFATPFARAALGCLSPRLFVQYVDCGILYLTDAFLAEALRDARLPPSLRVFLLGRIRDTGAMLAALRDDPVHGAATVHHYAQQLGIQLPSASQMELLEGQDDSFFLPLTVFREHVKKRDGSDGGDVVEFVYRVACAAIRAQLSAASAGPVRRMAVMPGSPNVAVYGARPAQ